MTEHIAAAGRIQALGGWCETTGIGGGLEKAGSFVSIALVPSWPVSCLSLVLARTPRAACSWVLTVHRVLGYILHCPGSTLGRWYVWKQMLEMSGERYGHLQTPAKFPSQISAL